MLRKLRYSLADALIGIYMLANEPNTAGPHNRAETLDPSSQRHDTAAEITGFIILNRVNDTATDSWSGSIEIADKITESQAKDTLYQFPFCDPVIYMGIQAKERGAMGEKFGRREIVYPLGRLFVEISIMGPKPIEVPEIKIRAPQ